jgi:hypothetical protein
MRIDFCQPHELTNEQLDFWKSSFDKSDEVSFFISSPEWYKTTIQREGCAAVVVTVYGNCNEILALMPFYFEIMEHRYRLGGKCIAAKKIRILKCCGGDVIDAGKKIDDFELVWGTIFRKYQQIDALYFYHVNDDKLVGEAGRAFLKSRVGFPYCIFKHMPHYRFVLPETLQDLNSLFLHKMDKKMPTMKER